MYMSTPRKQGATGKTAEQKHGANRNSPLANRAERYSDTRPTENSPTPADNKEPSNVGRKPARANDRSW